jgi:hypothetical protein
MNFVFKVENGKLEKVDFSSGRTVAVWSPVGSKIVGAIPTDEIVIVREDPENFPADRSNIYALNENLTPLWTAQQEKPDDFYTSLTVQEGRVSAVTRSGLLCQLSRTTGLILETKIFHSPVSTLDDFYKTLAPWKSFFNLAGGSILYCVSALLILYGIVQIVGPVLATSYALKEILPCVGVLNLYELTLLGVLLLIVVGFNVTDDAISLVVLVVLFLIANGIALDTVATEGPKLVLIIGVACSFLAFVKLVVLKRFILVRLEKWSLAAGGIVLFWNFTCGPFIAVLKKGLTATTAYRREPWLVAWFVLFGAAVLVLMEAARRPGRKEPEINQEPFLRTGTMKDIFMFLVLVMVGIHQYAMAYLFNLPHTFGDFIPMICLCSLVLVEFIRNSGKPFGYLDIVVGCVPLGVTFLGILSKKITSPAILSLEGLWYPPVMLGLTGAAILWLSLQHRRSGFFYVAGAYAVGVILTAGGSPGSPYSPYEVNWSLCGIIVVFMLLGLGIWFKNANLCFAGAVMAAIGVGLTKTFGGYMSALHVEAFNGTLGLVGLVTLLVYLFFPRQLAKWIVVAAALAGMIFLFDFVPRESGWRDIPVVLGVVGLCVAIRIRAGDLALIIPLAIPALWRLGLYVKTMSAWGYIVLSFLVLAAGAWVSIRKGRNQTLKIK